MGGLGVWGRGINHHDGNVFIVDAVVVDGGLKEVRVFLEPAFSQRLFVKVIGAGEIVEVLMRRVVVQG